MSTPHPPPKADPSFVFGIALVAALALWLPVARATLAGRIDMTTSAFRFLAGLAFAWVGVWLVATVWVRYDRTPRPATAPRPTPVTEQPQRRRDDGSEPETSIT